MSSTDRRPQYKPQAQAALGDKLRRRNPWKWWRLQRDFQWAQRELKKMGYDPEEIRWLM